MKADEITKQLTPASTSTDLSRAQLKKQVKQAKKEIEKNENKSDDAIVMAEDLEMKVKRADKQVKQM